MRVLSLAWLPVWLLASAMAVAGERSPATEAEIDFLLEHVRTSQLVFIRNGKDHGGAEAHEHMMAKYRHFDRKIDSTEAFIEYSATRSLISGRPYRIRLPGGREMDAAPYLLERLTEYRASRGDGVADP